AGAPRAKGGAARRPRSYGLGPRLSRGCAPPCPAGRPRDRHSGDRPAGRRRRNGAGADPLRRTRAPAHALGSVTASRPAQALPSSAASAQSFSIGLTPPSVKSVKKLSGRFGNTVSPAFTVSLVT